MDLETSGTTVKIENSESKPNIKEDPDACELEALRIAANAIDWDDEILYNCDHCMAVFVRKYTLRAHVLSHIREFIRQMKKGIKTEPADELGGEITNLRNDENLTEYQRNRPRRRIFKKHPPIIIGLDDSGGNDRIKDEPSSDWDDGILNALELKRKRTIAELKSDKSRKPRSTTRKINRSKSTTNKKFQCPICDKILKNQQNLNLHQLIHTGERPFQCDICQKRYTRKNVLERHMTVHAERSVKYPVECNFCGKKLTNKHVLRLHVALHFDEKAHKCQLCDEAFITPGRLRYHMLSHDKRNYKCELCDKSFIMKGHLKGHILERHLALREHQCEICLRKYTRKNFLKKHRRVHDVRGSTPCHICDERCRGPLAMFNHIYSVHTENGQQCYECSEMFESPCQTAQHHYRTHSKAAIRRTYKCTHFPCMKVFTTPSALARHFEAHNNEMYVCSECARTFVSEISLERHMNVVHPLELQKCGMCGLQFLTENELIIHEKIHYAQDFQDSPAIIICSSCNKPFDTSSQYDEHVKTCVVDRRDGYPCSSCSKRFHSLYFLMKHLNSGRCVTNFLNHSPDV